MFACPISSWMIAVADTIVFVDGASLAAIW